MEEQIALLTRAIWTFVMVAGVFFGLFFFLVASVVIAEFIRRERTETKDDDWIERRKRE